jgi:hypothetical protein
MKKLLAITILSLCFITPSQANDIRDFQIEGMSIGDSLLDYVTEDNIKENSNPLNIGKKKYNQYKQFIIPLNNEQYTYVSINFEAGDSKYLIKSIAGRKYYKDNIDECYDKLKILSKEIKSIANTKMRGPTRSRNNNFPKGKSFKEEVLFLYKDRSHIRLICYDYSKKDTSSPDRLSVVIWSSDYNNWRLSLNKK